MVTKSFQIKFTKSVTNSVTCLIVTSPPKKQKTHKALAISNNTKFLTLDQCLIKISALFMYNYHKNSLPKIFCNFFLTAKSKNVVTRSNLKIIPVTVSKQSVNFWGPSRAYIRGPWPSPSGSPGEYS